MVRRGVLYQIYVGTKTLAASVPKNLPNCSYKGVVAPRRGCDGEQCGGDAKVGLWRGGDGAIAGDGAAAGYRRCYVLLAEVPSVVPKQGTDNGMTSK